MNNMQKCETHLFEVCLKYSKIESPKEKPPLDVRKKSSKKKNQIKNGQSNAYDLLKYVTIGFGDPSSYPVYHSLDAFPSSYPHPDSLLSA